MSIISSLSKLALFTLTLLYHSHIYVSSLDPYFNACFPIKCGNVSISYPFRIREQQKSYCGYPGFEISCQNGDVPTLNISGNSYVIQQIWYEIQSFRVINYEFSDAIGEDCGGLSLVQKNLSLEGYMFKFATNYTDGIIVLKNCPDGILKEFEEDRVKCGALAVYESDPESRYLRGQCRGRVVSMPYDGGSEGGDAAEVLKRGLMLHWTANNCSACTDSGGQCGFDQITSEFKCYCRDRPHSHDCPDDRKQKLRLILGLGISGGILLIAFLALWYCKVRFNQSKLALRSVALEHTTSDLEKGSIYFEVPLFSCRELEEATENFNRSKVLGDGGFGTVYYGKLRDRREVAVKRLYEKNYRRVEQFMNEVHILTRLRHQNLVSLFGCTSRHSKELLLVYEYVPNGTVADHLYGDKANNGPLLLWSVRMSIAIETASALCYLHASDIIHRDVKTNNILLDSTFTVKVADFGLSRLFPIDVTHVSTAPQGTPGYLDPEYHQCYQLTAKSDVYSFGVVLIELISSMPAVDMNRHRHEINLSNYAMNRIQQCAFGELVDPRLGFDSDFKVRKMTTSVAELAFQCLQHDKEFRPSMDEVLEALKRIEGVDYEALEAQEAVKSGIPPPSPTDNEDAKLLSNHQQPHPPSPDSVMDSWGSKTTTPSTSK